MENPSVLDLGFKRKLTPEEESQFHLLKLEAGIAGRRVRQGRYAVYVLTAIFAFFGLMTMVELYRAKETLIDELSIQFLTGLTIGLFTLGVVFGGLSWLSFKYPVPAFLAAIGIFLIFVWVKSDINIISMIFDIAWKGIVVYYLVRGILGARQLSHIHQDAAALGITPEELL